MTKKIARRPPYPCKMCASVKRALRIPYLFISKIYVFIFARPSMQIFNHVFLGLALRGQGYNNCCDPKTTGEEIFIKLLAKHNPLLCIDIGANLGLYSQRLLEVTNSKVIAFEPLPKAFETLKILSSNYNGRLVIINKGVGNVNAELELFYGEEDSEYASFSKEVNHVDYVGDSNKNSIKTQVITLDSYFENEGASFVDKGIDLLKIDTEGYEYEVLLGASKTIKMFKPKFIQIEYNWHQLFKNQSLYSLAQLLEDYDAYQLLPYGSGLNKTDVKRPESNIYCYSNFVFVRNDLKI